MPHAVITTAVGSKGGMQELELINLVERARFFFAIYRFYRLRPFEMFIHRNGFRKKHNGPVTDNSS